MLEFNPFAIVALISAGIALALGVLVWSRRPGRGIVPFTVLMLAVGFWSFSAGMDILSLESSFRIVFVSLTYAGIVLVPAAWLVFVLEYTGNDAWITRRNLRLLAIHPVVTMLIIATNNWHGLFWSDSTLNTATNIITYTPGPVFWLHSVYSYVLLLAGVGLLVVALFRAPSVYRGQITLLIIGQLIPWVANGIYISNLTPFPSYFDLTPLGFTVTGVIIVWSLYRFRLLDLAPVAHHAVFDSMTDAVFVLDAKNRIIDANAAALRLVRQSASEVIGQPAALIFGDQEHLVVRYRGVESANDEVTITRDDETLTFQLRLSPLRDRGGLLNGRTIVLHDVTELKRTNRKLEEARIKADESARLKSEFLATVSHELRTPLSAIIGYTELMLTGLMGDLDEGQHKAISRIDDNGSYLLRMISDILDLSKIEAGHMDIVDKVVDSQAMIAAWQQQGVALVGEKQIDLQAHLAPDFPAQIYADSEQLTQIVVKLLSNAIKFTEAGSVILNVSREGDTHWLISVKDTGIGIPEDAQKYIFEGFRQVESLNQRTAGGTGLGLTIVERLTTLMNGEVWVESEVGVGSTFFVKLPLKPVPVEVRATS